jgi:hypothetical protein
MQILKNIAIGFVVLTVYAAAVIVFGAAVSLLSLKAIAIIAGTVALLGLCYCIGISVTGE